MKELARKVLTCATFGLVALGAGIAHAAWPEKPVRLIVPTAPGGAPDIVARLFGDHRQDEQAQLSVFEEAPGPPATAMSVGVPSHALSRAHIFGVNFDISEDKIYLEKCKMPRGLAVERPWRCALRARVMKLSLPQTL